MSLFWNKHYTKHLTSNLQNKARYRSRPSNAILHDFISNLRTKKKKRKEKQVKKHTKYLTVLRKQYLLLARAWCHIHPLNKKFHCFRKQWKTPCDMVSWGQKIFLLKLVTVKSKLLMFTYSHFAMPKSTSSSENFSINN